MDKVKLAFRIIYGLFFLVFGLNGFLNFIPAPPSMPEPAGQFAGALAATGYMFPLIKGTEVIAALLILSGRFAGLGLVLLSPIVVNIVLFHTVLAPSIGLVVLILLLHVGSAWLNKEKFQSLFSK